MNEYKPRKSQIRNKFNHDQLQVRIGINCGSVAAGIIGKKRITYDLWGDAVNNGS